MLAGLCVVALIGGAARVVTTTGKFSVPGTSMENTIMPGDIVLADRTAPVHRGDVIVEEQPSDGSSLYILRVIGLPGDHVACCDAKGRLTVNGKALDETYLYPGDAPSRYPVNAPSSALFIVTVPAGKFWLMGDHRSRARDSRTEGALAVRVVGRVFLIERSGHAILLRTPQAFTASGLAPASEPTPAPAHRIRRCRRCPGPAAGAGRFRDRPLRHAGARTVRPARTSARAAGWEGAQP